jgi:hypothetical protein
MVYRDINRRRVSTNGVDEKYAELFAQGKPIHPYNLQCKAVSILKYSSPPLTLCLSCVSTCEKPGLTGREFSGLLKRIIKKADNKL